MKILAPEMSFWIKIFAQEKWQVEFYIIKIIFYIIKIYIIKTSAAIYLFNLVWLQDCWFQ